MLLQRDEIEVCRYRSVKIFHQQKRVSIVYVETANSIYLIVGIRGTSDPIVSRIR